MCLAVPARILSMADHEAEIELGGLRRTVSVWLTPEARVGDYVYIHAGYAISVLDAAEAEETLRLLEELSASYEAEDLLLVTGDHASLSPDELDSGQIVNSPAGLERM